MRKQILTFSLALLLTACATGRIKQIPADVRAYKKVNYFAQHTRAAFKAVGTLDGNSLEGLLTIQKIGEEDFDVQLLTGGTFRVLYAIVSPEGVAYRYLFKDVDNALVRGRITQFLNLLLQDPGVYQRSHSSKETVTVVYKNDTATIKLFYRPGNAYPYSARTSASFNNADMTYDEYAPSTADGDEQLPHILVYVDGKIRLDLTLISLR